MKNTNPLRVITSSRFVGDKDSFNCQNRTIRIRVYLECGHFFDEYSGSKSRKEQLATGKRTRCEECGIDCSQ